MAYFLKFIRHSVVVFPEKIYQRAIEIELKNKKIPYEKEKEIVVKYDNYTVGLFRLDIVIDNKIIVGIKAVERLPKVYREQLISQLKASFYKVGLLVNFGAPKLEYIRLVRTKSV